MVDKPRVTLLWPGTAALFQPINQAEHPETLKKIVQKARFKSSECDTERHLFGLFGADATQVDLPVAQLRSPDQIALCADPCYLHADRDRLLVFSKDLALTEDDALQLIATVQPLLETFDATLLPISPSQWLLTLQQLPALQFYALASLEGQSISDKLPIGSDQRQWLRLWNEIQMALFEHPVNQQRQAKGLLPINAIWFWGSGKLTLNATWQQITGEFALLHQLCQLSGMMPRQQPDFHQAGQQLHVLPEFEIEQQWSDQLLQIEEDYLRPCWQLIHRFKAKTLRIVIPHYGEYQLSSWKSWW